MLPAMAATETRLLVLGAVRLFEPVNGYQIRRELMSWEVDQWAHINPGSIYSSLSTLGKQGYVDRHDLVDGTREVAVYRARRPGAPSSPSCSAVAGDRPAARPAAAAHRAEHVHALRPRRGRRPLERRLPALDVTWRSWREKHAAARPG